jgi:hypothetical protein
LIYRDRWNVRWIVAVFAICAAGATVSAQSPPAKSRLHLEPDSAPNRRQSTSRTASIHWQGVSLRDAIARLRPLFDQPLFVDRRVDPELRVSLDIEAASAEQVLNALASEHQLGVSRLGRVLYLGPVAAAAQLKQIAVLREKEAARLQSDLRTSLAEQSQLSWPRLSEPRQLVISIADQRGWRLANPEKIPHDVWDAGELPELTAIERLSLLLIGFNQTFELKPVARTIEIVELPPLTNEPSAKPVASRPVTKPTTKRTTTAAKQVYTLRVQEKPVGAVLRELSQRLHWAIQIDEDAIRAAGKSLDKRVSFSVENADQEKLLDALLTPAGLEYELEGEQVRVMPRRYEP